jgi:cytochrome P450
LIWKQLNKLSLIFKASEDYNYEGIEIKKHQRWAVAVNVLHYDPEIYPQPDSFNPERFTEEGKKTRDISFMPFGAGPRNCIGKIT